MPDAITPLQKYSNWLLSLKYSTHEKARKNNKFNCFSHSLKLYNWTWCREECQELLAAVQQQTNVLITLITWKQINLQVMQLAFLHLNCVATRSQLVKVLYKFCLFIHLILNHSCSHLGINPGVIHKLRQNVRRRGSCHTGFTRRRFNLDGWQYQRIIDCRWNLFISEHHNHSNNSHFTDQYVSHHPQLRTREQEDFAEEKFYCPHAIADSK